MSMPITATTFVTVITASVTDDDGSYVAQAITRSRCLNVAPERTIDGDDTVDEGSPFTLNLSPATIPAQDTIASVDDRLG